MANSAAMRSGSDLRPASRMPSSRATTCTTSSGSRATARSMNQAPSGHRSRVARATSRARVVFPVPAGPTIVTSGCRSIAPMTASRSWSRPMTGANDAGRLPARASAGLAFGAAPLNSSFSQPLNRCWLGRGAVVLPAIDGDVARAQQRGKLHLGKSQALAQFPNPCASRGAAHRATPSPGAIRPPFQTPQIVRRLRLALFLQVRVQVHEIVMTGFPVVRSLSCRMQHLW